MYTWHHHFRGKHFYSFILHNISMRKFIKRSSVNLSSTEHLICTFERYMTHAKSFIHTHTHTHIYTYTSSWNPYPYDTLTAHIVCVFYTIHLCWARIINNTQMVPYFVVLVGWLHVHLLSLFLYTQKNSFVSGKNAYLSSSQRNWQYIL